MSRQISIVVSEEQLRLIVDTLNRDAERLSEEASNAPRRLEVRHLSEQEGECRELAARLESEL